MAEKKQAVIATGGKQYLVTEGETIEIELVDASKKAVDFQPLLVIDGDKTTVGKPEVTGAKVTAEVIAPDVKDDKVTSIRYKSKKRVHKTRGHRQHHTVLKISKIS